MKINPSIPNISIHSETLQLGKNTTIQSHGGLTVLQVGGDDQVHLSRWEQGVELQLNGRKLIRFSPREFLHLRVEGHRENVQLDPDLAESLEDQSADMSTWTQTETRYTYDMYGRTIGKMEEIVSTPSSSSDEEGSSGAAAQLKQDSWVEHKSGGFHDLLGSSRWQTVSLSRSEETAAKEHKISDQVIGTSDTISPTASPDEVSERSAANVTDTEYDYDKYGRSMGTRRDQWSSDAPALDAIEDDSIEYDALGRRSSTETITEKIGIEIDAGDVSDFRRDSEGRIIGFTYTDEDGNVMEYSDIRYDEDGNIVHFTPTDEEGISIHDIQYDSEGNVINYSVSDDQGNEIQQYELEESPVSILTSTVLDQINQMHPATERSDQNDQPLTPQKADTTAELLDTIRRKQKFHL